MGRIVSCFPCLSSSLALSATEVDFPSRAEACIDWFVPISNLDPLRRREASSCVKTKHRLPVVVHAERLHAHEHLPRAFLVLSGLSAHQPTFPTLLQKGLESEQDLFHSVMSQSVSTVITNQQRNQPTSASNAAAQKRTTGVQKQQHFISAIRSIVNRFCYRGWRSGSSSTSLGSLDFLRQT